MRTFIIDDEKNVVDGFKELIQEYCPHLDIIGDAGSIHDALQFLNNNPTDLIFLDIELKDGSGLDLLKRIENKNYQIIFITAYDKYAVEAFKFSSVDYLLKPIDPDDLVVAVKRAEDIYNEELERIRFNALLTNLSNRTLQSRKLIVTDKENIHALPIEDILYLKADGAYTHFIMKGRQILSSKNLKLYEQLLTEAGFFRTHHSYLVNLTHMTSYNRQDVCLNLVDNHSIPVSSRKRELLLDKIKDLNFI